MASHTKEHLSGTNVEAAPRVPVSHFPALAVEEHGRDETFHAPKKNAVPQELKTTKYLCVWGGGGKVNQTNQFGLRRAESTTNERCFHSSIACKSN